MKFFKQSKENNDAEIGMIVVYLQSFNFLYISNVPSTIRGRFDLLTEMIPNFLSIRPHKDFEEMLNKASKIAEEQNKNYSINDSIIKFLLNITHYVSYEGYIPNVSRHLAMLQGES
jgi:hypothetical protein